MASSYQFADADVISPEVYGRISHPHEAFVAARERPVAIRRTERLQTVLGGYQTRRYHRNRTSTRDLRERTASNRRTRGHEPELRQELIAQIFERLKDSPKLLQVLATSGQNGLIRSLVQMDAPDHPKYRELVQPWFKPANLKRLEDRLEVITKNILDDMMGDGSRVRSISCRTWRYFIR
jgi:cytochrome P450